MRNCFTARNRLSQPASRSVDGYPRTADPAIVARAIEEISNACRGNQVQLALTLGRLIPEFEHNIDGLQVDARAGTGA